MEQPAQPGHLGHLDGLRAVAAIYVLFCHAFLEVDFTHTPLGNSTKLFLQLFFFGHYAVDLFIVLSGFCLMLPVIKGDGTLRGGALCFLKRRAWRIIPPYYCALGFSLLLIVLLIHQKTGTHWDVSIPVTEGSVFTHLLLLQDVLGDDSNINHVFWSISVEWRIYFLFPLLIFTWSRFGSLATAMMALICSYLIFSLCQRYLGNPLAAHYVGLFAMGMLGANITFPSDKASLFLSRLPWTLISGLMTVVVLMMLLPRWWDGPLTRVYIADGVVGGWSMSILVAASRNARGWLARSLRSKPLVFVGTFAYSVYLIHAPLLQVLWQYPFSPLRTKPLLMFAALILVGTPLILGISYAFFLAFERPFLRIGKRQSAASLAMAAALQPAP